MFVLPVVKDLLSWETTGTGWVKHADIWKKSGILSAGTVYGYVRPSAQRYWTQRQIQYLENLMIKLSDPKTRFIRHYNGVCFGKSTINMFASRPNHKVGKYCAWQPDPNTKSIDDFMHDWSTEELVCASPLFSIIHMMTQKLIQDTATGILIVPFWANQPWFTLLVRIIDKQPITVDVANDELFFFFSARWTRREKTPSARETDSRDGALCNSKSSPVELLTLCSATNEHHTTNCMKVIGPSGKHIVTPVESIGILPVYPKSAIELLQQLPGEHGTQLGYSAVCTARSAMAVMLLFLDKERLGDTRLVKQFLKGLHHMRTGLWW